MEHLDVLIVGAGLSGIGAAHHLQTECPWASYAVLEGREAIGGTWDLFRYPGIRSDSDMFTLGYSFRPWKGDKAIADGASILQYIRDTAAEAGIDDHIRFRHRVVAAAWSSDDARWTVTVERHTDTAGTGDGGTGDGGTGDGGTGDADEIVETVQLTCSFLFSCSGYYRYDRGYLPDFAGMDRFGGQIVHPQEWPEDLDHTGKRIVVIGSGATAVTLVPSLARTAAHVTMLQRSPTYVVSLPAQDPLANGLRSALPTSVSGPLIRWYKALTTQGSYVLSRRQPNLMKAVLRKGIERQLPAGYDIDTHFTPSYDPWDQRLCVVPDADMFKAIRAGTASVVTDRIETFTESGLRLESGDDLDADIIVTATGLELLFLGGIELTIDGEPADITGRLTYKGMMLEDVPNLAIAVGYTNASWTLKAELTCEYVCRLLNTMRERGLRQCMPVNDDPSVGAEPLLGLSSGYITRSVDRFPSSGTKFPWQVHQSYLRDYRAMRMSSIDDAAMRLSNPDPGRAALAATGARHPRFGGRVAAVTGAGSGIGRALAVELARRGTHLALCDIDEAGLAETVTACEGHGVKVTSRQLDVADRDAVHAWADSVVDDHGTVNLVFNNAGVALGATVEGMSYDDLEWLMDINFWGVVHGTKAFLPHLKASGDGHIVNLSSVFGLVSIPSQSAYNASKFAVRGFTDALRMELEIDPCGVSCTTVHPGGIRTNIARRARVDESAAALSGGADIGTEFDRIARTSPESAARQILAAVERDRRRALIGADATVIDFVSRLPARLYQGALVRGARLRR